MSQPGNYVRSTTYLKAHPEVTRYSFYELRRPDQIARPIIHARHSDAVSIIGNHAITTLVPNPGSESIRKISVYNSLIDLSNLLTIENAIRIAVVITYDRQFDIVNAGTAIDKDVEPVFGKNLG